MIDGRRSTVDNTWRLSTCSREIILNSEVGKSSRKIYAYFEDVRISYLFDEYSPASGGFAPIPEAFDLVEERPRTLCIGSKYRAHNDCIDLYRPEVSK